MQTSTFTGPDAYEQLMIELINRARLDPTAEVARVGTTAGQLASGVSSSPVEALAVVAELDLAAQGHSDDMLAQNFFAHTNPNTNKSPFDRMRDEGYNFNTAGENIGWIGSFSNAFTSGRIENHHVNLWESDGHQRNILNGSFSEIGVGFSVGAYNYNGTTYPNSSMLTQNFGDRGHEYLTGVIIDDLDGDSFYDIGEGQGGVRITASNASGSFTTTSWAAGGYSLRLAAGTYSVTFEGGDLAGSFTTSVTIGSQNVKLDVIEGRDASSGGAGGSTGGSTDGGGTGGSTGGTTVNDPAPSPAAPPPPPTPTAGDDVLSLDDGDNRISGRGGHDTINGLDGNDRLFGAGGNDALYGDAGNDMLRGDGGHDTLYGGLGDDIARGGAGDDTAHGGDGNDNLGGGGGDDTLMGDAGDDVLMGQAGNDLMHGGDDADMLKGGGGNDSLFGDGGDDDVNGQTGNDLMHGGDGNDSLNGGGGHDNMHGDGGSDLLEGKGGNDIMDGGDGNDLMLGGFGHDLMTGGGGDDSLIGSYGRDTLLGGDGADYLDGGRQDDVMSGGTGADTFVFNRRGGGDDVVTDFNTAEDQIEFGGFRTGFTDLSQYARVDNGDLVIEFGIHSLTLQGVTDVNQVNYDFA